MTTLVQYPFTVALTLMQVGFQMKRLGSVFHIARNEYGEYRKHHKDDLYNTLYKPSGEDLDAGDWVIHKDPRS